MPPRAANGTRGRPRPSLGTYDDPLVLDGSDSDDDVPRTTRRRPPSPQPRRPPRLPTTESETDASIATRLERLTKGYDGPPSQTQLKKKAKADELRKSASQSAGRPTSNSSQRDERRRIRKTGSGRRPVDPDEDLDNDNTPTKGKRKIPTKKRTPGSANRKTPKVFPRATDEVTDLAFDSDIEDRREQKRRRMGREQSRDATPTQAGPSSSGRARASDAFKEDTRPGSWGRPTPLNAKPHKPQVEKKKKGPAPGTWGNFAPLVIKPFSPKAAKHASTQSDEPTRSQRSRPRASQPSKPSSDPAPEAPVNPSSLPSVPSSSQIGVPDTATARTTRARKSGGGKKPRKFSSLASGNDGNRPSTPKPAGPKWRTEPSKSSPEPRSAKQTSSPAPLPAAQAPIVTLDEGLFPPSEEEGRLEVNVDEALFLTFDDDGLANADAIADAIEAMNDGHVTLTSNNVANGAMPVNGADSDNNEAQSQDEKMALMSDIPDLPDELSAVESWPSIDTSDFEPPATPPGRSHHPGDDISMVGDEENQAPDLQEDVNMNGDDAEGVSSLEPNETRDDGLTNGAPDAHDADELPPGVANAVDNSLAESLQVIDLEESDKETLERDLPVSKRSSAKSSKSPVKILSPSPSKIMSPQPTKSKPIFGYVAPTINPDPQEWADQENVSEEPEDQLSWILRGEKKIINDTLHPIKPRDVVGPTTPAEKPPPGRKRKARRYPDPQVQQFLWQWNTTQDKMTKNNDLHGAIFETYAEMASANDRFKDQPGASVTVQTGTWDTSNTGAPPFEFFYSNDMYYQNDVPEPELGAGCECEGPCDPQNDNCLCVRRQKLYFYGLGIDGFSYTRDGKLKQTECPIWECGPNCGCPPECQNRVIQRGRSEKVKIELFKTHNRGWGVKAKSHIPEGTFIGIYAGEMISEAETERRAATYIKTGRTYLFDLDGYQIANPPPGLADIDPRGAELAAIVRGRAHQEAGDKYGDDDSLPKFNSYSVDAFHFGFTRFLNHSCDPNLRISQAYVNDFHPERPLLVIFASRNILPNEELNISYKGIRDRTKTKRKSNKRNLNKTSATVAAPTGTRNACLCGALDCNGDMFAWSDSEDERDDLEEE